LNQEEKLRRSIIGHIPQSNGWLLHKLICPTYSLHGLIATNNILNKYFINTVNEYDHYIEAYKTTIEILLDVLKEKELDLHFARRASVRPCIEAYILLHSTI